MKEQYQLKIGIMSAPTVEFTLVGKYRLGDEVCCGRQSVRAKLGHIYWNGRAWQELVFVPTEENCTFVLHGVTIGVGFHWQRCESQVFSGGLRLIVERTTITGLPTANDNITAINQIGVEDYLTSVISSEMSATSSPELLKVHAIISRSWTMNKVAEENMSGCSLFSNADTYHPVANKGDQHYIYRRIVWYERESHRNFDFCSDDHCQRYQGLTRVSTAEANVRKAIQQTWGKVLTDNEGRICDTRFYKCCGGRTELFSTAWADRDYSYLVSVEDSPTAGGQSFCNVNDKRILAEVLNGYDLETTDFYQWQVRYSVGELSAVVKEKTGVNLGNILELKPLKRGQSGRIYEMEIVGTSGSLVVGKELEIRRVLSRSHLYSSAFDVEKEGDEFVLNGKGWGHGVGLCQIGAAVMADKGYSCEQILSHYFPNTMISNLCNS